MTDAAEVAGLLAERPDLEPALHAALATDRDHDSWTFDDIDIDSGSFGELVGRDIVINADDGGYQLADPEAVEQVLSGEFNSRTQEQNGLDSSVKWALPKVSTSQSRLIRTSAC